MTLLAENAEEYVGGISGVCVSVKDGNISVGVKANSGEIWLPISETDKAI